MMDLVSTPRRPEINQYAIKFLIGAIAFALPLIESVLTLSDQARRFTSISASFWIDVPTWSHGLWPRNIFVGLLFAIAGLLLTYNGQSAWELRLTKIAALAALMIAMFPCGCQRVDQEIVPGVHMAAAGVMFGVLAIFCEIFRRRAIDKCRQDAAPQPKWRAWIYAVCAILMVVSIGMFVFGGHDLLLAAEWIGLWAFSASWLTASHVVPGINLPDEREHLFRDRTATEMAKGAEKRAAAKRKATTSPN